MLKNEQIVSPYKEMCSGFKQLLAKVTYDEPPLVHVHVKLAVHVCIMCAI